MKTHRKFSSRDDVVLSIIANKAHWRKKSAGLDIMDKLRILEELKRSAEYFQEIRHKNSKKRQGG
ncbi:MAG: hypothetical protein HZB81_08880 [Deltaproteobacteria bacterium]|nr:hypothetical protein [Deltaproteobacteria bacterium]